jgi:hypothetical protein
MGLYYQWGRPTPFPGSTDLTGSTYAQLYDGNGVPLSTPSAAHGLPEIVNQQQTSMANAVMYPTQFYTDPSGNWIDPDLNATLWPDDRKSPWDPCPDDVPFNGKVNPSQATNTVWRVPLFRNRSNPAIPFSPWNYPLAAVGDPSTNPSTSTDPALYQGAVWTPVAGGALGGYDFASSAAVAEQKYRLGWYPANGSRSGVDGSLSGVGTTGMYWSSTLGSGGEQQYLEFNEGSINPYGQAANISGTAATIRCTQLPYLRFK